MAAEVIFVVSECPWCGLRAKANTQYAGDEGRAGHGGIDLSERILLLSCK